MNISHDEHRALHVLALGGQTLHEHDNHRKITAVTCFTRKGLIESRSGSPYRISKRGRTAVRPQIDNQGA